MFLREDILPPICHKDSLLHLIDSSVDRHQRQLDLFSYTHNQCSDMDVLLTRLHYTLDLQLNSDYLQSHMGHSKFFQPRDTWQGEDDPSSSLHLISYNEALSRRVHTSLPPHLDPHSSEACNLEFKHDLVPRTPQQFVNLFNHVEEQPPSYGSPDAESPHSSSHSNDVGGSGGERSQKGKKRRRDSVDADNNKSKMRKIDIACNFCRSKSFSVNILLVLIFISERKLRCNGKKLSSCSNCAVRDFRCTFVPVLQRRGLGKAQKGSHLKKAGPGHLDSSVHQQSDIVEFELNALPTEIREYVTVLQGMVVTSKAPTI